MERRGHFAHGPLRGTRLPGPGAKVIVFTQFDDLKRRVAAAFDEFNIKTVLLQGNVQHRSKTIHDWQERVWGGYRAVPQPSTSVALC